MTSLNAADLKLASKYECTGCLVCENICPQNAIIHELGEDGHVYIRVNHDKCIGCLKCQEMCRKSRGCFGNNNVYESSIYAAWTNNNEERARATSGGVFAALARWVINSGGCVVGSSLKGFECRHIAIYDASDIHLLQGSKYMASSMEDVYSIITEELSKRDVLFAGLGCQCAGVLSFFEHYDTSYQLYTVDLVCGGIPSHILIDKFLEEYPDAEGIRSFRSKEKYELIVETQENSFVVNKKSLPLHGFNCGMTNRYSCYNCQFAKAHRRTDITIGDLWDRSILPEEHKQGVSMVLVHSDKGRKLLKNADLTYKKIDWRSTLLHNKRIVCGHQNIYFPRKILTKAAKEMDNKRFTKLYCITMTPKDIGLFLFRIYRYIREKKLSELNTRSIIKITQNNYWRNNNES